MSKNKHYRSAFLNIFLWYFVSTMSFVLLSSYLYINKQNSDVMQKASMDMYIYYLQLRDSKFTSTKDGYSYEMTLCAAVTNELPEFDEETQQYTKVFSSFYRINMDKEIIDNQISSIKLRVMLTMGAITIMLLLLSWLLARISLRPMQHTISHLDRFLQDLIHDLNTPVASLKINLKILGKKDKSNLFLSERERMENGVEYIASLYENLSITLKKELAKESIDIVPLIDQVIERHKRLYPKILFESIVGQEIVATNKAAFLRIVDNIISNSCKYSKEDDPFVKVTFENGKLSIEDNGKGMKYPQKIFERNYQENESSGYGIGAHIIYRLSSALHHKVIVKSIHDSGTTVVIKF